jgi:hemoglobin/transferrin/lactoferrin receptor protein
MTFLTKPSVALLLMSYLFCQSLFGQKVKVIDALTQRPLEEVFIVSQDNIRYSTSDKEGSFDLADFSASDDLNIKMMGYESLLITQKEIKKRSYIIALFLDEKKLSEIILSVARTAAQSEKIAEKVSVISKTNIKKFTPRTGAELLQIAPSVRLQQSQAGGGSPVLRGFEANRVLLVVDGVRLNNAIYRSGHLQNAITIDPNSIERVEIIYGSSSVGYGSDALGGVVHYYTKTPKINNAKRFDSGLSSRYTSAQNALNYHLETEVSFNKWASYTSVSFSDFGDVRMGKNRRHGYRDWGLVPFYSANTEREFFVNPSINSTPNIQKNTGYSQWDILHKIAVTLPMESQFLLNIHYSTSSNIPRFDKLNEYRDGSLRYAEWYYGPQERLLISPQLKLFPKKRFLYKGTITTAFQQVEESRIQRRFSSLNRETQKENVKVYGINGDFEFAKKGKTSFAYGFELIRNNITSTALSNALIVEGQTVIGIQNSASIPTRYPSGGSVYSTAALYGNYRLDISPKTTFALGTRYTATRLEASWKEQALIDSRLNSVDVKNDALTGSISLSYRPQKPWRMNLLFSSGFRAPNVDDLGKIRENKGTLLVPNPNLQPEFVYNIDGGISFVPKSNRLNLSLRFYNSSLRDYIGRMTYSISNDLSTLEANTVLYTDEVVTTMANANIGNARIYGLSFEGKWTLTERLSAMANITYTDASENSMGPLPSILPFFGGADLAYEKKGISLRLRMQYNGAKKPEDYSFGGEDGLEETPIVFTDGTAIAYAGSPKWTTFSLFSNYQFANGVGINIALENIFDTHYRTFASGISAPGRSLNLGLNIDF